MRNNINLGEFMNKKTLAALACLATYSIFGFSFLFSKTALSVASPFVLLAYRFWAAFIAVNIVLFVSRKKISLKGKPVGKLLLLGTVQPVIYYICETYGIGMTSSSFSGIILGLIPVIGLLLGRIFLKEKSSLFHIICAFLSIIGVALTTGGGEIKFSILGTVLLLGAAFSSALYTVISRDISNKFSPLERTYVMFALGCVFFTFVALIQNRNNLTAVTSPLSDKGFIISVLYLAVISSVCAFLLLNFAVNYINIATVSVFSNFCTVISVLAGIFIMHDSFSALQIFGIIIILISVFGISIPDKKQKQIN